MSDLSEGYEGALEAGEFDNDVPDEFASASFTGGEHFVDDILNLTPEEKKEWERRIADEIEKLKISEPRLFMPYMISSNNFSLNFCCFFFLL